MYITLFFWLLLLLPGYAVARHVAKDDLESGFLGVIGISYLLAFAVLSPFSILGYVFEVPLAAFSVVYCLAIVAGAVEITRNRWWRQIGRVFVQGLCLGMVIVGADMAMGAFHGSALVGDAVTHLARIRALVDHGMGNHNPFVGPPHTFPIYHTNLLHALQASCSQLTGVSHIKTWFVSLAWAKLVVASGSYVMVWCVFERRWVAWIGAVLAVAYYGPTSFLVYPNKLAPLWICAIMIGWTIRAGVYPGSWNRPVLLGAGALVLGQLHGLYAGFACVVLIPVLGFFALYRWVRKREHRWYAALCVVAVSMALPFPLITRAMSERSSTIVSEAAAAVTADAASNESDERPWTTMPAQSGWGTLDARLPILVAGTLLALMGRRRNQAAILLAIVGTVALIFYVPPLCSAFIGLLGERWMLSRMSFVLHLGLVGLGFASLAYSLEPRLRSSWQRSIVSVLVLLVGVYALSSRPAPYNWPTYWASLTASKKERTIQLRRMMAFATVFQKHIPRGSTVLADPWRGMVITAVHDCRIVAPKTSGAGIQDIRARLDDVETMLAPNTLWDTRRSLLRKYGVTHFLPGNSGFSWAETHARTTVVYAPGKYLYTLDLD